MCIRVTECGKKSVDREEGGGGKGWGGVGGGGAVENQAMGWGRGQDILEGRVFEREPIIH